VKGPVEFQGQLELVFAGLENGKAWSAGLPGGLQAVQLKQYGRLEGLFMPPPGVVIKSVTARVKQGQAVQAMQSLKL
jgi:hypothetical protein